MQTVHACNHTTAEAIYPLPTPSSFAASLLIVEPWPTLPKQQRKLEWWKNMF